MFEHTRPRNEPGKAVLDNSGTQDDGRSSRNHLELVLKPKIQVNKLKNQGFGEVWGVGGMGEAAKLSENASARR